MFVLFSNKCVTAGAADGKIAVASRLCLAVDHFALLVEGSNATDCADVVALLLGFEAEGVIETSEFDESVALAVISAESVVKQWNENLALFAPFVDGGNLNVGVIVQ